MKKRKVDIFIVSLVFVLLFMTPFGVLASEKADLYLERYEINNNQLTMQVKYSCEQNFEPSIETSKLKINNQTVPITELKTESKTEETISYLFIIDVSGSMDQKRVDDSKEIINKFIESKKENDLICIVKMGNEMTNSGFLKDVSSIQTFFFFFVVTKEDTNLYKGICEELDYFTNSEDVSQRKCMIIFSDGADDQVTGITREEATERVKENNVPIYTVALLKESPSKEQVESSKVLGSFARCSFGGKHFTPGIDEIDNQDIYDCIFSDVQTSIVITADVSEIEGNNETAKLILSLSNENVAGELQEEIDGIPFQKEEVEMETVSEDSIEESELPAEDSSVFQKNRAYFIIGSIIIALLMIGTICFLIRKKKSTQDTSLIKKAVLSMTWKESGVMEQQ